MTWKLDIESDREEVCDTLVIGGGPAGSAAAISAGRCGSRTILVEAGGTLGGQMGIGQVTPLSSVRSPRGCSFGGLTEEILLRVKVYTEAYVSRGAERVYPVSPFFTQSVLAEMAAEAAVHVRFHTTLCAAETDGDRIAAVILHDKSGFLRVRAHTYIDATGDADLAALVGDETVLGSEPGVYDQLIETGYDGMSDGNRTYLSSRNEGEAHRMQPVSLFFRMADVDYPVAGALNNKVLKFGDLGITKERFLAWKYAGTPGFEITSDNIPTPQGRVLLTPGPLPGEAVVNMSRILNINGADADDLSRGELLAREQLTAIVDFLITFVPGFEKSRFLSASLRLGVRESRRLVGRYVLSGRDVIDGVAFPDAVCRGYYIIDIHDPTGKNKAIGGRLHTDWFEVPYRSLCSARFPSLLAAGRCLSADHVAMSAVRIQGICILSGQAAGCAAALAAKAGIPAGELDTAMLREKLKNDGIFLEN